MVDMEKKHIIMKKYVKSVEFMKSKLMTKKLPVLICNLL